VQTPYRCPAIPLSKPLEQPMKADDLGIGLPATAGLMDCLVIERTHPAQPTLQVIAGARIVGSVHSQWRMGPPEILQRQSAPNSQD
jgi:hypothetical protein